MEKTSEPPGSTLVYRVEDAAGLEKDQRESIMKNFKQPDTAVTIVGTSDEVMAAVRAVRKRTRKKVVVMGTGSEFSTVYYSWASGKGVMTVSSAGSTTSYPACTAAQFARGEMPIARVNDGQYTVRCTLGVRGASWEARVRAGCKTFTIGAAQGAIANALVARGTTRLCGALHDEGVVWLRGDRIVIGADSVSASELPVIRRLVELAGEVDAAARKLNERNKRNR